MLLSHRFAFYVPVGLLTSLLFSLAGCQPDSGPTVDPGYGYFPLETGRYVVYEVQEQRYALGTAVVQQTYQLKEVTGDPYLNVTGQAVYRLIRYRRSTPEQPWQPDSLWSARLVNNEAIRTENGLDFVNLQFPVTDRLRWNGNRYNPLSSELCSLRNSGWPYRVSDKQFDQTVTVEARNDSTLLAQDKRLAVYARGVGMIYKERIQLQFCSSGPACIGTNQIDYGIRQIYRIRAYGRD